MKDFQRFHILPEQEYKIGENNLNSAEKFCFNFWKSRKTTGNDK